MAAIYAGLYGTWEPRFELFICSACMTNGGPLVDELENAAAYHSKCIEQLGLVLGFNVFIFIPDRKISLPFAILL